MKKAGRLLSLPLVLVTFVLAPQVLARDTQHAETAGVSAEVSFQALTEGNNRYTAGFMAHPRQDGARRKELAAGQKPHAIVLTCSDSRVPPELVFDQGLGEIFTIRVAGNILANATVASIEYAVEHLGSRLIVVMGHESCGAVKAALTTPKGQSAGTPDLDSLIQTIQPNIASFNEASLKEDPKMRKPAMANVDGVAKDLVKRSKVVQKAVEEGKVSIVKALYNLESGKVEFWDAQALEKKKVPTTH